MTNVLVFIEQKDGAIAKASLTALTAAKSIASGGAVSTLTLGPGSDDAAKTVSAYGVTTAFHADSTVLSKYLAVPYAAAVSQAMGNFEVLVLASTSNGKDLAPRVAAALEAGQASDIIGVNADGSLRRPMYAGDIVADVTITTPKKVVTVRASAFPAAVSGPAGVVQPISLGDLPSYGGEVVGYELSKNERPELGDASTVVSGGRALQSAENFEKYIFPLADAFGAAVGASRAAVDSGYAPNDWQVGQTGKIVAPQLYVAVGISGAIQHLAGMKDSKVIVAINKDADAPIYEVADFGLVADLFQVVPELTKAVKEAKH